MLYDNNFYDNNFYEQLDDRMSTTCFQQFTPQKGVTGSAIDPITGREVLKNTARSQRTFQFKSDKADKAEEKQEHPVEKCIFCRGQTPSTLFYISEAKSHEGGTAFLCDEEYSIYAAKGFFSDENIRSTNDGLRPWCVNDIDIFYRMLERSSPHVLRDMEKENHPWLWRSFFNLTPSFIELPSNCILLASHPEYHYLYLDQMPPTVVSSMVEAWKVWEGYVEWKNSIRNENEKELRVLPFVNGGKRPEAGQSMFCFHSQVYLTPIPTLFNDIQKNRSEQEECPLCSILSRKQNNPDGKKLEVYHNDTMVLCMHPAPLRNFAMIALPLPQKGNCPSKIADLKNSDVADVLQRSISIYRRLMGKIPAYNISVRCGPEVGHLHIQIVPKTETNILAGYEDITRQIIITQDPEGTADILRRRYA